MIKKTLFLILLSYVLVLFQASFLVHFQIAGMVVNLVFISVLLWNFFEREESVFGVVHAFFGGLFLDIFSQRLIGFHIVILVAIALFLKFIFKRYVRIPFLERA